MESEVESLRKDLEVTRRDKENAEAKLSEVLAENERLRKEVAALKSKLKQVAEKITKLGTKSRKEEVDAPTAEPVPTAGKEITEEPIRTTDYFPRRQSRKKMGVGDIRKPLPNPNKAKATSTKGGSGMPAALQAIIDDNSGFTQYSHPVFGAFLHNIITEEQPIHYFLKTCIKYLLTEEGLTTTGLFRVPGAMDEIQHYKKLFDEGREVHFNCGHHEVAGLIKEFIKNLPEPLIPNLYNVQVPYIIEEYKKRENADELDLLSELQYVISCLPKENYELLKILILFLSQIVAHSDINKMTLDNIIKCIVPTVGCYPAIFFYTLGHAKFFFD